MREYIEIIGINATDVLGEMSRKVKEDFEFVSLIVKAPTTFLLRMRHNPLKAQDHPAL